MIRRALAALLLGSALECACSSSPTVDRALPPPPSLDGATAAQGADSTPSVPFFGVRRRFHGDPVKYQGEVVFVRPNRYRETIVIDGADSPRGREWDGKTFRETGNGETRTALGTRAIRIFGDVLDEGMMYREYEREPSLAIAKLEKITEFAGGKAEAYAISHAPSAYQCVLFFDPVDHRLIGLRGPRFAGQAQYEREIRYFDHRWIGGRLVPMRYEVRHDGELEDTVIVDSVEWLDTEDAVEAALQPATPSAPAEGNPPPK